MRPSTRAGLLAAALRYAAAGIPVMPLHTPAAVGCSCREAAGCASAGKHPRLRHGLRDATLRPQLIRAWWRHWPTANIGLATGTVLDVCDIDTNTALAAILDLLKVIRPTGPLVRTGAGWHLWFAASGLPSRVGLLPGVDWRGRGGLIAAPPSVHASGATYRFQQPWQPAAALPSCPAELRRLVLPRPPLPKGAAADVTDLDRYTAAALAGEVQRILLAPRPVVRDGRRITGGGRNDALNTAAFRLAQLSAGGGVDEAAVRHALSEAAQTAGLSRAEIRRTLDSGWRAGLRHPRRPIRGARRRVA
ncbi:bifunctional DNA primase/polymerase [Paractinoplanes rishiriensis]|nr:bifunctional DNA primase/polymerase [Actinoplanes rishiriensis]